MSYLRQLILRIVVLALMPVNVLAELLEFATRAGIVLVTAWTFRRWDYPPLARPEWRTEFDLFVSALLGPFRDADGGEADRS
jgi:hypothetical protein